MSGGSPAGFAGTASRTSACLSGLDKGLDEEWAVSSRHSRRNRCLVLGALVTAAATGCAGRQRPPDPFLVPAQDFFRAIHTLVLVRVVPPPEMTVAEARLSHLDSMIAQAVEDAGFAVVESEISSDIWQRVIAESGPLYDPYSGERDESEFAAARSRFVARLVERFDADAVLYPQLWIVDAPFSDGVARWDGTTQPMLTTGGKVLSWVGAIAAALASQEPEPLPVGRVRALSLEILIEDLHGDRLYQHTGGIQTLEMMGWRDGDVRAVPDDEVLADRERNRRAVDIALAPLRERRRLASRFDFRGRIRTGASYGADPD